MFHYKTGLAYSVKNNLLQLYHDVENNTLLNDFFFYLLHNLPSLQNMHEYRTNAETDYREYVRRKYPALVGPPAVPETYFVSKQLVAYLETLIAFSPYYRADDGSM